MKFHNAPFAVRNLMSLGAVTACLFIATETRSEVKNFTFHGTIAEVQDPNFQLDGSITNGTPFEGFYVFDTSVADSNPDPTVGDYWFSESTFGVVLRMGSYVFRTNPKQVSFLLELVNRPDSDHYLFRSYHNVCSEPLFTGHLAWQLDDSTAAALAGVELPLFPPALTNFQSNFGLTVDGTGTQVGLLYMIRGHVEMIEETPSVIPEPPATTLKEAVEVSWPSKLGYYYQIQVSEDLIQWTDIGAPVLGDGAVLSRFFPQDATKNLFYRAEIANFQKPAGSEPAQD